MGLGSPEDPSGSKDGAGFLWFLSVFQQGKASCSFPGEMWLVRERRSLAPYTFGRKGLQKDRPWSRLKNCKEGKISRERRKKLKGKKKKPGKRKVAGEKGTCG